MTRIRFSRINIHHSLLDAVRCANVSLQAQERSALRKLLLELINV
jgi:formyltetrahydrofolate hydrolase